MESGFTIIPNLLMQYFKQLGLSHDELILILQLKSLMDKGEEFPDSQIIAERLHLNQEEVFRLIHQLIHKKVLQIKIKKTSEGKTEDVYSLDFLWEKLSLLDTQSAETEEDKNNEQSQKHLYQLFEEEFSRPLSPIEIQTIGMWQEKDGYSLSLIEFALREAVLSQVYSLKYIDRILLTWEKKNIRTREQAEKESSLYRERSQPAASSKESHDDDPVPLHNWLNGNQV